MHVSSLLGAFLDLDAQELPWVAWKLEDLLGSIRVPIQVAHVLLGFLMDLIQRLVRRTCELD